MSAPARQSGGRDAARALKAVRGGEAPLPGRPVKGAWEGKADAERAAAAARSSEGADGETEGK